MLVSLLFHQLPQQCRHALQRVRLRLIGNNDNVLGGIAKRHRRWLRVLDALVLDDFRTFQKAQELDQRHPRAHVIELGDEFCFLGGEFDLNDQKKVELRKGPFLPRKCPARDRWRPESG